MRYSAVFIGKAYKEWLTMEGKMFDLSYESSLTATTVVL